MGIFDRFRPTDSSRGRTYEGERMEPSPDEQALARYRYMLKTAPPDTLEQAHVEAFAKLTPEQRRMLLDEIRAEIPDSERAYATEDPRALARVATRAEVRQPGTMERLFSRVPASAPGFGGVIAGTLLGSMAGSVLGTMIAQNFLGDQGFAGGNLAHGQGEGQVSEATDAHGTDPAAPDMASGFGDVDADFDGGSFDV